jgi:hypothetical protein
MLSPCPPARSSEHAFPSENELRPETDRLTEIDLSLIRVNLKLTPWERILANDDTVNFCDMGRADSRKPECLPKADRRRAASPTASE